MDAVINVALPVFGLALLGYFAVRGGWFPDSGIIGLSRYVFDWAVPALLIRTFANAHIPETIPWELLITFYLPAALTYLFGAIVAAKIFGKDFGGAVIAGFASSYGNSVMVGIPLVLLAFGDAGAIPFFILMSFHGLSYFMATTVLITYGQSKERERMDIREMLGELFGNPIILGLIIGIVMNRAGWTLPGPIDRIAEYLQLSVIPCALFALGANMTRYQLGGQSVHGLCVVALKNVLFPLTVWVFGSKLMGLPEIWTIVAVVLASTPTGVNVFLFAQRFNVAQDLASTSVLLSTAISIFALSFVLYTFS